MEKRKRERKRIINKVVEKRRTLHKALWISLFLIALSIIGAVGEESSVSIGVEEAVDMALERNLRIQAAELSQKRKEISKDMTWNNFLPSLSASGTLSYQDKTSGIPGYTPAPWDISASISAQLRLSGELFASIRETMHSYETGLLQLEEARKLLERDVKKSFYTLLFQQEEIALARKKVAAAERLYKAARENYESGLVPEYSVLSARVSYENTKPEVRRKERAFADSKATFKQLIGLDKHRECSFTGSISMEETALEAESLIQRYLKERFDIQKKQGEIESYRLSMNTLGAGLWPDLSLGASFSGSINGPFGNPWFGDSGAWNSAYPRVYLSLSLPLIDLLPGSAVREEMAKLKVDIQRSQLELMDVREKATLRVEGLVADCVEKGEYIDLLSLNLELAEESYRIAEENYNSGTGDLSTVEDAQLELEKAEGEVLHETYNYLIALLDLEYELNTPLEEFIQMKE